MGRWAPDSSPQDAPRRDCVPRVCRRRQGAGRGASTPGIDRRSAIGDRRSAAAAIAHRGGLSCCSRCRISEMISAGRVACRSRWALAVTRCRTASTLLHSARSVQSRWGVATAAAASLHLPAWALHASRTECAVQAAPLPPPPEPPEPAPHGLVHCVNDNDGAAQEDAWLLARPFVFLGRLATTCAGALWELMWDAVRLTQLAWVFMPPALVAGISLLLPSLRPSARVAMVDALERAGPTFIKLGECTRCGSAPHG